MNDKTTIIWDWNGTLFNDVDICVDTINTLLIKYKKNNALKTDSFTFIFCCS